MKRGLVFSIILALLIMPAISAYSYGSPLDYLNDEWVKFGIVLGLLFLAIFSFIRKRTDNAAVSAIAGLGLAALISVPIMQRGLIEPFLNPDIVDWIAIIAIGIALIFLFYKFGMRTDEFGRKRFSSGRLFIFLLIFLALLYLTADYLPDNIMYGPIGDGIDMIKGLGATTIVIIFVVLIVVWLAKFFWGRHVEKRGYKWRYGAQKKMLGNNNNQK